MRLVTRVLAVALVLSAGAGWLLAQPAMPAQPGQAVQGTVHQAGDERYRLAFGSSGTAWVEVAGAPADCAFQVGSQGFQESDSSPSEWTDGQPGQPVRHSFRVQAGRPGTLWVKLRTRASGMSGSNWSAVACSGGGPYYAAPDRDGAGGRPPGTLEGRAVQPPIGFRLLAQMEGAAAPAATTSTSQPALSRGWPGSPAQRGVLRDERMGFSLEYPQHWSAGPEDRGTYTLAGGDGALVTVTVVPKAQAPNSSGIQILLRLHERLTNMGADLAKLGATAIGGETAAFASHVYDDKNPQGRTVPFDHVQLVVERGVNYYLIAFVAPHDAFAGQTGAFKEIFKSWRFLQ